MHVPGITTSFFSSKAEYEELRSSKSKKSEFLRTREKEMVDTCAKSDWPTYIPCDEIAMAAAIDNAVVEKSQDVYATVELDGTLSRGLMIVDWTGMMKKSKNIRVVQALNVSRYKELLKTATE